MGPWDWATWRLIIWMGLYLMLVAPGDRPWLKALALLGLLLSFLSGIRLEVATDGRGEGCGFRPAAAPGLFLFFYLLLTLIAYLVSPLPALSLPRLLYVTGGFFSFAALFAWLKDEARLRQFVGGMALFGGGMALVGLFTVQWPERQVIDLRPLTDALPHLSGPYSLNQNAVAGLLLLFLPFAWAVARPRSDSSSVFWPGRWVGWGAAALILFLLFLTQSRNAWLALPVMAAAYWSWGRCRFRWLAVMLLFLTLLPFTVIWWPELVRQQGVEPLATLDTLTKTGQPPPQSWLSRLEIWSVAGQAIQDYPIWGTGLFTFVPISRANYLFTVVSPDFDFTHAHNLFLQATLNLGVGGALVLAGWLGMLLWGLWRPRLRITTDDTSVNEWGAVVGTAFVGYWWFNLFDMLSLEQRQGIFVWLLLAAAARLTSPSTHSPLSRSPALILPIILLLLLPFSPAAARNWHFLRLDQSRFTGQPLVELPPAAAADARRTGLVYWTQGDEAAALAAWQQDTQAVPFLRQQGSVALLANNPTAAIRWYDLALQLDGTDGPTYFWRGVAQMERGNDAAAQHDFQQAIAYLPAELPAARFLQAKAWEQLGRIEAQEERWESAAAAFAQAAALFPDNRDFQQQLNDVNRALAEQAAEE